MYFGSVRVNDIILHSHTHTHRLIRSPVVESVITYQRVLKVHPLLALCFCVCVCFSVSTCSSSRKLLFLVFLEVTSPPSGQAAPLSSPLRSALLTLGAGPLPHLSNPAAVPQRTPSSDPFTPCPLSAGSLCLRCFSLEMAQQEKKTKRSCCCLLCLSRPFSFNHCRGSEFEAQSAGSFKQHYSQTSNLPLSLFFFNSYLYL